MATISIIVPVYNAATTLRECVDSILSQEFKDFELILVDDGSKDSSPQICDEYAAKDKRIQVFHKENGGVSAARNHGLDYAKGEWVTFIDADDYITKGYFDGVIDYDEDILIKGYRKFDHSGDVSERKAEEMLRLSDFPDFLSQYATDSLLRAPWAKFYKRSLIDKLRFLTDMKIGEDAQFVFRYLARCQTYRLLTKGEYIVRAAEETDEVKYAITVDYAINSLHHLFDAYKELLQVHPIGHKAFASYLAYFKRISKPEWHKKPSLWYRNEDIHCFYKYVWKDLEWKQKVKYLLVRWFCW